LRVGADATIGVADFFFVNGSFGVQSATRSLSLSDGTTVDADVLTIGGKSHQPFPGINGGTANAAGLSLSRVNFGLRRCN
jgi:hypothetical protein